MKLKRLLKMKRSQATKQESSRNQAGIKWVPSRSQAKKGAKQKQILDFCFIPRDMKDIMIHLEYKNRYRFRINHIKPLLNEGLLSMTFPDRPNHQKQKYITTEKGKEICCRD